MFLMLIVLQTAGRGVPLPRGLHALRLRGGAGGTPRPAIAGDLRTLDARVYIRSEHLRPKPFFLVSLLPIPNALFLHRANGFVRPILNGSASHNGLIRDANHNAGRRIHNRRISAPQPACATISTTYYVTRPRIDNPPYPRSFSFFVRDR